MADDIASIGVKVDTKGIEQGAVALDVLASKGDAVDKAMSQVEGATARAKKSLDTLGQSARGQSGLEKVGAGAKEAAKGVEAVGSAAERAKSGITGIVGSLFSWGDAAKKTAAEQTLLHQSLQSGGDYAKRYATGLGDVQSAATSAKGAMGHLTTAVTAVGSAFAAWKVADVLKDATMLAARYETMGVVMGVAGNNAGYTRKEMEGFAASLQKSGISMMQSRNALTQLATAHIDLSKAAALGRAAQDLAVVGGINSSEALERMIHGIKSGQVEILRTMGLNVNFEQSYKDLARTLNKSSDALTEQEKTLARTNATLQAAKGYVGIYEESMTTAGKAMGSLTRYWEDLKVKAGEAFLPSLSEGVNALTEALKAANKELQKAGQDGVIDSVASAFSGALKIALQTVAVLGANVAFVIKGIIGEVKTLATQAVALMHLDFKGAAGISDEWTAEAQASRAALDAFEAKIMGTTDAMKEQAAAAKAGADAVGKQADAAKGAASATEQQRIEQGKLSQLQQAGADAAAKLHDAAQKSLTVEQQRVKELQKLRAEYEAVSVAGARTPEQLTQDTQNYWQARRAIEASNQPSINRDQLLDAIARVESGGRQFDRAGNTITSNVGALGMYQIMPGSGPHLAQLAGVQWSKARLAQDADYGRTLANAYIEYLLRIFDNDAVKALTAYHSGQGTVGKAIAKAGVGGDWLQHLGPNGRQYANLVLGQFTQDYKGNYSGLRDGSTINKEAIKEQAQIREMQDATRASTAALQAEQQGYNKIMAEFVGLKVTDKWQAMSDAMKAQTEQSAVAKSNQDALSDSHKALESATQGTVAAWANYAAATSGAANSTAAMAQEQARYDKLIQDAAKNQLTEITLMQAKEHHLRTMAQLQEQAAVSDAASLAKQADQLEEANKHYGKSAVAIGETKIRRIEDAQAAELQANGVTKLAEALGVQAMQQGRVNEAMKQAEFLKFGDRMDEWLRAAQEQSKLYEDEARYAGMSALERAKVVALKQVELKLAKELAAIDKLGGNSPEDEAERERLRQKARLAAATEGDAAVAKVVQDEWNRTADSINQSLTDALLRGFESGKDFAKNFRDTLLNMFKTLVLRPVIQATLAPVAGGMAALMGGNASAGQGGSALGMLGNVGSVGNWLSGGSIGSAIFGNSVAYGAMVPGLSMGGTQAAMLAAQTGEFGLAGATATASAGGAGAGGFGALLSNPVTIAIGALAMLGLSGAFSRKHKQHNLQGTFGGASGFEGNWHDYYKGGLLRSSKTVDTPLDSATLNALRGAWKAQEAMVIDYAKTLGLATDKIEGFTFKINLKLKDLGDPEAAGYMVKVWQMVNEAIATGSNEMAERILGTWTTTTREVEETIKTGFWDDETFTTVKKTVEETTYAASEYAREGERAIDTLTRLATSLQATNAAFDMLGLSLYEASLAGGDMASKLIDQMGGMDAFGAQVGAYWQNYYTEAERHAYMTVKMTEALAAAGLEMPTTVAGFRALVDAQDLTTDAGRAAFTALMSVNAAFTEVYGNADAAAGSIAGLGDELAAMEPIVFGAASDLASVIEQGLLGTITGAQLGEQMADVVMQGMYSAIAGGFSQQITALMVEGVLNPMIAAAMTGASMSDAVSQAAIDRVIQHAQAAAAAINAVLSDPGFKAAIQQVQAAVGSISVGIQRPEPIYDSYAAQNARALAAQREAERMADEAKRLAQQAAQEAQRAADEEARRQQGIMNERLGLTKQLLQLEGNTVLLRQIELEALDPSNRALQQRIWAIEDETAAAEKYKSALKDAQDFLGGFTKNIEEFIFKVSHAQADAQQSYQMAAAKFTAQMTLARGGDRDAMNGITGYADTLIGSIRRESTTGAEANLRIARVLGQLASLPKQISAEQLIVDAIVNAKTSLETVLSTNFASLDANVDGLLTADELAASGLATNTQISALMARVDANGDGMISKQELANSRLQTLATEQATTNTNLGNVTSAQNSTNSWLSQIQMADVGYSLSNINAINAGAGATVAAINKTNASLGAALVRDYSQMPVVAQFSSDSPLFSIFAAINETNAWLYHIHGLETHQSLVWKSLTEQNKWLYFKSLPGSPIEVRSENRTPANGTVFADGGYTGPGAKWEPAGVVHKGEVVWSQADVARWGGPGIVDALRQGAPGYADGGPVAVRVPQIYVPPVGRSNEETQALLREVLAELRAQRSDDRARHSSLAEPLQRMDRRGAKWDKDGLPAERTNEAIA